MRFVELLQRLPRNDAVPEVVAPQRALTTEALAPTGYVEPTFDEFDWPDDSAVLLIEAAGAVGKSVAAEALAAELKWPLVSLGLSWGARVLNGESAPGLGE